MDDCRILDEELLSKELLGKVELHGPMLPFGSLHILRSNACPTSHLCYTQENRFTVHNNRSKDMRKKRET